MNCGERPRSTRKSPDKIAVADRARELAELPQLAALHEPAVDAVRRRRRQRHADDLVELREASAGERELHVHRAVRRAGSRTMPLARRARVAHAAASRPCSTSGWSVRCDLNVPFAVAGRPKTAVRHVHVRRDLEHRLDVSFELEAAVDDVARYLPNCDGSKLASLPSTLNDFCVSSATRPRVVSSAPPARA